MPQPAPPVYHPQRVADVMVPYPAKASVRHWRADILVKFVHAMEPPVTGWIAAALLELYLRQEDPAPVPDDNLFVPVALSDTSHGGRGKQN